MKWSVLDGLAIACLVLAVPYGTCDKEEAGHAQKNGSHEPHIAVSIKGVAVNGSSNSNSTSLGAQKSSVNSTKSEIILSSREGVLKVQSSQAPKEETSSGTTSVAQVPNVGSAAENVAKKQGKIADKNETQDSSKHWAEGGPPAAFDHQPKLTSSQEPPKSSTPKPVEEIKASSQAPHVSARKGAGLPPDAPSPVHPLSEEHPGQPPMIPIKSHPVHAEPANHPPALPVEAHPVHGDVVHPHSSTTVPTAPTTTRPKKLKPHFTMVRGDRFSSSSESIIESPTTGRDYVFPLVLLIFAVPGTVFLIRFLYKRGTEFTERQQYHRMYLIDGMYNAR